MIRAADIGVSPIARDPVCINSSPIKAVEYLNLDTPVVGTDIDDQKGVIENSGGGICTKWDIGRFVRAMIELLDLPPDTRREMGQRERAWVKKTRFFSPCQ